MQVPTCLLCVLSSGQAFRCLCGFRLGLLVPLRSQKGRDRDVGLLSILMSLVRRDVRCRAHPCAFRGDRSTGRRGRLFARISGFPHPAQYRSCDTSPPGRHVRRASRRKWKSTRTAPAFVRSTAVMTTPTMVSQPASGATTIGRPSIRSVMRTETRPANSDRARNPRDVRSESRVKILVR